MLAVELEKISGNEANLVLKGYPILFGDFNTKRFKNLVKNNGPEYAINNLKCTTLNKTQKDDILHKYNKFK
jgi:hypothetical protein